MRPLLTALALVCLALPVAACGGNDGGGGGGGGKTVTVPKGQPVKVAGREYKFDPGNVTVQAGGGPITIEFTNAGSLAHNLKLERDGQEVGGTATFQAGKSESVKIDLKPGTYQMICSVGDHANRGMKGTLTVK